MVGIIGELLITSGLVVLLFIGWQLWFYDGIVGNELQQQANAQSQRWNEQAAAPPSPDPSETPDPDEPSTDAPPVQAAPANAQQFGMLVVPRWGADYYRPIAQGVGV